MLADEINELWDARPFHPFEIVMADGGVFTVTSPKLMLIIPQPAHPAPGDARGKIALAGAQPDDASERGAGG